MHMNVPADDDTVLVRTLRKLKWTLICLAAPEYVTWDVVDELWQAHMLIGEFAEVPVTRDWTLTHAFLLKMGGISLITPSGDAFRPSCQHFLLLARAGRVTVPELHREDIDDKSKADWIVKALALIQIGRFALVLLGRILGYLPVSTLELFTVIIIFYTIITYACWWHKPKDVNRPFRLCTSVKYPELSNSSNGGMYTRFRAPGKRVALTDLNVSDRAKTVSRTRLWAGFLFVTMGHGPLHALAWNYQFPTAAEQMLWRVATIVCSLLPLVVIFILSPPIRGRLGRLGKQVALFVVFTCFAMYALLRLYLLTESLVSIRSVPSGVYRVVRWSAILPGIGIQSKYPESPLSKVAF
jgi:hypothetical protein